MIDFAVAKYFGKDFLSPENKRQSFRSPPVSTCKKQAILLAPASRLRNLALVGRDAQWTVAPPLRDRKTVFLEPLKSKSGIERLQLRIQELKELDPRSISERFSPRLLALSNGIVDTVGAIFGHGTPKFERYQQAAYLLPLPNLSVTPDWIAAREGYSGRNANEVQELQQGIGGLREGAIALLEQAIRSLKEELSSAETALEFRTSSSSAEMPSKNAVFVVHGHDEAALHAVARFLEQLKLEAIVLREQPDSGRTIIEKFEHYANRVGFAVVLLTPDDVAGSAEAPGSALRARQNVIFELGYFTGKLGRGRACLLRKGKVEIPSDLYGVIYKDFDPGDGWKLQLVKELKAAQLDFDANRMWA